MRTRSRNLPAISSAATKSELRNHRKKPIDRRLRHREHRQGIAGNLELEYLISEAKHAGTELTRKFGCCQSQSRQELREKKQRQGLENITYLDNCLASSTSSTSGAFETSSPGSRLRRIRLSGTQRSNKLINRRTPLWTAFMRLCTHRPQRQQPPRPPDRDGVERPHRQHRMKCRQIRSTTGGPRHSINRRPLECPGKGEPPTGPHRDMEASSPRREGPEACHHPPPVDLHTNGGSLTGLLRRPVTSNGGTHDTGDRQAANCLMRQWLRKEAEPGADWATCKAQTQATA